MENLTTYLLNGNYLEIESENEHDYFHFELTYNKKKNKFSAGVSIYHASEDNNANNPESHTDEEEYYDEDLKTLILELMKIYGQDFTEAFVEAMVK
jgi:hypothetical protein